MLIVSVDGGCAGVQDVKAGMHRRDVAAVSAEDGADGRRRGVEFVKTGEKPSRLHRHRRDAHHRQADERRRQDTTSASRTAGANWRWRCSGVNAAAPSRGVR